MSDVDTVKQAAAKTTQVDGLNMTPMDFFAGIWDGSWKVLAEPQRSEFVARFHELYQGTSTLREKLDAVIWAGHVDGSVPESIKPVRAPRTGETGGRKAAVKSPAELLLKK